LTLKKRYSTSYYIGVCNGDLNKLTIIQLKHPQDLARLRRLALAAQGLLQAQPFGQGLAGARQAINHIGYVQIDSISVVERAHHHILHSRVPNFKPRGGLSTHDRFSLFLALQTGD
jgi:hypothetical protein